VEVWAAVPSHPGALISTWVRVGKGGERDGGVGRCSVEGATQRCRALVGA
jgi:hypothetical protein